MLRLHLDKQIPPAPRGGLTNQQIAEAATELSQRANATAELLRGAHKLRLILVNLCRSTHLPKG